CNTSPTSAETPPNHFAGCGCPCRFPTYNWQNRQGYQSKRQPLRRKEKRKRRLPCARDDAPCDELLREAPPGHSPMQIPRLWVSRQILNCPLCASKQRKAYAWRTTISCLDARTDSGEWRCDQSARA